MLLISGGECNASLCAGSDTRLDVPVSIQQIDNRWVALEEIWYRKYVNGGYPKLVILIFYNQCPNMTDTKIIGVGATLAPLNIEY
jgi:hypothetical protein